MDVMGKCSIATLKNTISEYLESRFFIEKPTPFLQSLKERMNHALVITGLVKPEPSMWSTLIEDTPPHVLIFAVVMVIITLTVITKLIINKRNKKILANLQGLMPQVDYGRSEVETFMNGLSRENSLPKHLEKEEVRLLLRLFEKFLNKRRPQRRPT